MRFDVLTLFPEFFSEFNKWSIIGRAIEKSLVEINYVDIRDFSTNKHRKVDDYPYGGGQGMVMTPEPVVKAIESVKNSDSKVVYLSPQGTVFNQQKAMEMKNWNHIILIAGHYEGIDNRIIENFVDEEISIGDFVLTGGEVPAQIIIESVTRLVDGVLSSEESFIDESHTDGLLEYPQYTRPEVFRDLAVPEVLLSGNHEKIRLWREEQALENTKLKRPDLYEKYIRTRGGNTCGLYKENRK